MGCTASTARGVGSVEGGFRAVPAKSAGPTLLAAPPRPIKQKQSPQATQMLLSVFKYYDTNNDGTMSLKELQKGIAQTGLTLNYMKKADVDGDQKVSKQEWLNFFDPILDQEVAEMRTWLLEKQSPAAKEMLLEVFAKYDKSGDGVLSVAEITKGIEGTGLALNYMLQADKDGDRQVNKEEWLQFFDPIPDKEIEEVRSWLAVSSVPAKQKQSQQATQMLLSVFKYYDTNNDGVLSLRELQKGIAQTGLTLNYMKAADVDGDQKVSKQEWLNFFDPIPDREVAEIRRWLLEKQSPAAKEMLLEVFANYDKSGDGVLSVAEITKGIEGTALALNYMLEADKDGDRQVNKEEWLQFFDPIPDKEVEEIRNWLEADARGLRRFSNFG